MTREELLKVEEIANQMVRNNHFLQVTGNIPLKDALSMGAMALSEKNMVKQSEL